MKTKINNISNIPLMVLSKNYLEFKEDDIIWKQGLVLSCSIPKYSKGNKNYFYGYKNGVYIGRRKYAST